MTEECYLILHFPSLDKSRAAQVFRAALRGCLSAGGLTTNQKQLESPLPLIPKHLVLTRLCADTVTRNQTSRKLLWEEALVIYSWHSSGRKYARTSGTTPAAA